MATVVFSDVLCWVSKNLSRIDRDSLLDIVAKFYHEDELYAAKSELCKLVAAGQSNDAPDHSPPVIDGWAKLVNNKGVPIVRKSAEPAVRRRHEAEDLLQMAILLDVQKFALPKFAAEDLDRIPNCVSAVDRIANSTMEVEKVLASVGVLNDSLSKLTASVNEVKKRLELIEKNSEYNISAVLSVVVQRLDDIETKLTTVSLSNTLSDNVQLTDAADMTHQPALCDIHAGEGDNSSLHQDTVANPVASTSVTVPDQQAITVDQSYIDADLVTHGPNAVKTWADMVKDIPKASTQSVFSDVKSKVRVHGQALSSVIKAVPRQLTCFVGRLDPNVSEDELTVFLKGQGIETVKCRKLVAKNGRVYNTSAFRVTCTSEYESLFYNEALWPIGSEVRDWVFYNKNGGH